MTTSFHFTKRLAVGAIVSIGIIAGSVGTAFGWINPGPYGLNDISTAINFWNNCGPGDKNFMANDGDVVTTQKWNQMNCTHMQIWSSLFDWPRGKTPFIWPNTGLAAVNEIDGVKGRYVSNILLAVPGGGGGVNFYDANQQFPTQADGRSNVLGAVQYARSGQPLLGQVTREGLHLISTNGPVYVDTCLGTNVNPYCDDTINGALPSDTPGQYALGWVRINLYDTAAFDARCQYRAIQDHTGGPVYRYPSYNYTGTDLNGRGLGFVFLTAWGTNGNSAGWVVAPENKTVFRGPLGDTAPVVAIERLCLPTYIPGQNMP